MTPKNSLVFPISDHGEDDVHDDDDYRLPQSTNYQLVFLHGSAVVMG